MGIMVKTLAISFILGILLLRKVVGLCMRGHIYIMKAQLCKTLGAMSACNVMACFIERSVLLNE